SRRAGGRGPARRSPRRRRASLPPAIESRMSSFTLRLKRSSPITARNVSDPAARACGGGDMKRNQRREILKTAAMLVAGGGAASVAPASAQSQARTPFIVPQTFIPIAGSTDLFPVRRIYCIGRNYAAHAREMGSDPNREPPFFFQKPTDAIQLAPPGETIDHPYPTLTKNYHYEVELVAALGKGGRDVPVDRALDLVYGYT